MSRTVPAPMTLGQAVAALAAAGYSVRRLAASAAVVATLRRGELWASVVLDPDTTVPAVALHRGTAGTATRLFERDSRRVAGRTVAYTLDNAVGHGQALARELTAGVRG